MANFLDLFSNPSISKIVIIAAVVGVLVSLCASLLGVTLVLKRYSMIGDGLSHVGYGALAIIDCENQINQKINNLSECLTDYEPDLDNQQSIEAVLNEINILLDRRAEMKKRH